MSAGAERGRYRAALEQILELTDPGDLRSREAREAWEQVTPARRVAREALGLPIGGRAAPRVDRQTQSTPDPTIGNVDDR